MNPPAERAQIRYVAIGDSFTEGVGDELPGVGGVTPRGWADLVAQGIANATGEPIQYANLAIRGKLLAPIIAEQLDAALALKPTLLSFNGGGNDMLRPGTDMPWIIEQTTNSLQRILATETVPLLLAGADPTIGIPQGQKVKAKGDELTSAIGEVATELGIRFCNNWSDPVLARREFWDIDRLHLATVGHHRVAGNVLRTLGYPTPSHWVIDADPLGKPNAKAQLQYTKNHVLPWIKRRLTGTSSGDGRTAKYADWVWVHPE